MGETVTLWSAFVSQLTGDTDLDTYVSSRFFETKEKIINPDQFPFVVYDLTRIRSEPYICMPKGKYVELEVEVHGKVKGDTKIADSLTLDELIKDAIEKDLTIGGNGTVEITEQSVFTNLSKEVRESRITLILISDKFTAGDRS